MVSRAKTVPDGPMPSAKGLIESIRDYMLNCPLLAEFARVGIDYLGAEPTEYTINTIPTDPIVKHYTNGDSIRQLVFVFASREYYGPEIIENLANSDFYERLADWFEVQTRARNLPLLSKGRTARQIEALTSGFAFATDTVTAQYQIQCRLTYHQEG